MTLIGLVVFVIFISVGVMVSKWFGHDSEWMGVVAGLVIGFLVLYYEVWDWSLWKDRVKHMRRKTRGKDVRPDE